MRVLVVEDQSKMANLLQRGLQEERFTVDVATSGADALWRAGEVSYDVVLLDVMLPDRSGFEVCRHLRGSGVWSPVLMLTARDSTADRVRGLDAGADDYLAKPFSFGELLARMRALTRRAAEPRPVRLSAGDLTVDPAPRDVRRGDVAISVSPLEYMLLVGLMRTPDRVLTRRRLLEIGWEDVYEQNSNVLDVAINGLRAKIDRPFHRHSIETVRGVGYRLRGDGG